MNRSRCVLCVLLWMTSVAVCSAGTRTWDGKHDTSKIEVTVVYFVPSDRRPLVDWKDRVNYFCRRIEQFHQREFQGQSTLQTVVHEGPFVSKLDTAQLRRGDANAIFFRTLEECDQALSFATGEHTAFPILLVLSEINWQPLDDFYRLKPQDGGFAFEGQEITGQHFPGAAAGGSRATYLSDRGVGWGLVSADGWRVPYRGSDCVVYHEGCGHTVGLPHPEPIDSSVMGVAQYEGWMNESFLNKEQKIRLGWEPQEDSPSQQSKLFSTFRALPDPVLPKVGDAVSLAIDWPENAQVETLRVRYQTAIDGPWGDVPQSWSGACPETAYLGKFDRAVPVSYRVDVQLKGGETAEIWGYLQVRGEDGAAPKPLALPLDLISVETGGEQTGALTSGDLTASEIDVLAAIDPSKCWAQGAWTKDGGKLLSPKQFGARMELPCEVPAEYRMTVILEPLDDPNALVLGQRMADSRFVTVFSFDEESPRSAVENVDGKNLGNETTFSGRLFRKNQLSQVIVIVRKDSVTMTVDGKQIAFWKGKPDQLSLSDYWATPNSGSLFIGAYDCSYRFHRITVEPLSM